MSTNIEKRWPLNEKYTNLSEQGFKRGIVYLMNSTYFKFNDSFYKQTFGTPIGSPVYPMLTDVILQDREKSKDVGDLMFAYYRYVDDTFL